MVDLNMPEDLNYEERRAWLKCTGAALIEETGEPSGQVTFRNAQGRKSFALWWTEEEYHGPYEAAEGEHQDSASDRESSRRDAPTPKPTAES
ncbi:hypothetical protein ACTXG6_18745 [Pseudonocardia sp. Cha107L01]|uniref:hypothetical protein n=1 Tax=Pseudonocardia sp. Cha107L01 TaxID=3457576 RepID=UPI00403EDB86